MPIEDIYSVHIKVPPSWSAGPDPLQATQPHQELRCRLGMGVGGGAALAKSYTVLPYSTRDAAIPAPLPRLAE